MILIQVRASREPGARFRVLLPERVPVGTGLELREFVSEPPETGTLGPDGRAVLRVGATLTLTSAAPPGTHEAAFTVETDRP